MFSSRLQEQLMTIWAWIRLEIWTKIRGKASLFIEKLLEPFSVVERRLFLLVYGAVPGLLLGFLVGAQYYSDAMTNNRQLQQAHKEAEASAQALKLETVTLRTENQVNSLSLQELSNTVLSLENQLSATGEELRLYKSLMGAGQQSKMPFVRAIRLMGLSDGRLAYRVIVEQSEPLKGKKSKVTISAIILGKVLDGSEAQYDLAELDEKFPKPTEAISLRHFKLLEGEVLLPQGFMPELLETQLMPVGSKKRADVRRFPWKTDVALSPE